MRVPSSQHIGFNMGAAFALDSRAVQEPGASPFSGHRGFRTVGYKEIPGASPDALQTTGPLARFSTAARIDSAGYFVYRRYRALWPSNHHVRAIIVPYIPVLGLTTSCGYLQVNELLMHLAGGVDVGLDWLQGSWSPIST
jgi:hypothetical protein